MKKLNKVLCLVLALVMVLGCLGVTASATTLKDEETINSNYLEAVDVLNSLGILEGYEDGNFYPTKAVTRAQAAKLASYATMGTAAGKLADNMDDTVYTDMVGSSWANGYVNYCTNEGIVCGYNGKFRPTDTVTGYELCKMLLVAAGYGEKGEFVGTGWKSEVLKLARNKGITIAGVDLADTVTREEAAQYVFNAITSVKTVTYVPALGIYVENDDVEISVSGSATSQYENHTLAVEYYGLHTVSGVALNKDDSATLKWSDTCYLNGKASYPISTSAFDAGRTGYIWAQNGEQITDIYYTDKVAVDTYAASTLVADFVNGGAVEDEDAVAINKNGVHTVKYAPTNTVTAINPTVSVVSGPIETFVATKTQAAAHAGKLVEGRTYVCIPGVTDVNASSVVDRYVDAAAIDYTGVKAGDVVTYVTLANGKTYVQACEKAADGTITKQNFKDYKLVSVVLDGNTYVQSGLVGTTDKENFFQPAGRDHELPFKNAVVYVDNGGYVVYTASSYVAPVIPVQVAVVDDAGLVVTGTEYSASADVVLATGKGEVTKVATDKYYGQKSDLLVKVDKDIIGVNAEDHLAYLYGSEVVSVSREGVEQLGRDNNWVLKIVAGAPNFGNDLLVDGSTTFIIKNALKGTYQVVNSYKNIPAMFVESRNVEYIDANGDNIAEYVYIKDYVTGAQTKDSFFVVNIDETAKTYVELSTGEIIQVNEMAVISNGVYRTVLVEDIGMFTPSHYYTNVTLTEGIVRRAIIERGFDVAPVTIKTVANGYIVVELNLGHYVSLPEKFSIEVNVNLESDAAVYGYDARENIVYTGLTVADLKVGDQVIVPTDNFSALVAEVLDHMDDTDSLNLTISTDSLYLFRNATLIPGEMSFAGHIAEG